MDGILIAKFMPPHDGHQATVEFAARYADNLTVYVAASPDDPIDSQQRLDWVRQMFGTLCECRISELDMSSESAQSWAGYLREQEVQKPGFLFTTRELGVALARELGAHLVTLDPDLDSVELVSGSIRQNLSEHWQRLPRVIRRGLLKRVCVFGPESTGKSTLCEQLAKHYRTVAVPEYARTYLEQKEGEYELSDVVLVARGQRASEFAYASRARRLLLCDTDLLTLKIWSDWLFGECDPWLEDRIDEEQYDLYLLCRADVPWEPDRIRYLPNDRENFERKCEEVLKQHDCRYVKLAGGWDKRMQTAVEAIDELLAEPWGFGDDK